MRRFDCHAIEAALLYIQQKIERFEENVGAIRVAAAGKAWLSIKEAVDGVLQHGVEDASKKLHTIESTTRPSERQSGTWGMFWDQHKRRWGISWQDVEAGKRRQVYFSIGKFLQQGHDMESAIEAAFQKAKTHHEQLALDGTLPLPQRMAAKVSAVRGVRFHKKSRKWLVRFKHPMTGKVAQFGTFNVQEEAEVKARKIAKKFGIRAEKPTRRQLELSMCSTAEPPAKRCPRFAGV